MIKFDDKGREIPNQTPVSVPLGWQRPLSIQELIKRHIREEMSRQAADDGQETFEEADDFEVDEDPDPLSKYELPDAPVEYLNGEKDADASFDKREREEQDRREEEADAQSSGTDGRNRGKQDVRSKGDNPEDDAEGNDRHEPSDAGGRRPQEGTGAPRGSARATHQPAPRRPR